MTTEQKLPRQLSLSLAYDMRAPAFGVPVERLYEAAIEQCAWADRIGFESVSLMEHHASPDGYLPSPIVLAAAIAGVTRQIAINLNVVLLPLYHPVKLAEDLAVLDIICRGRLLVTVAGGYREEEYQQFDLDIADRPARMEEGIEVLKRAWSGEPFEWHGHVVHVLPRPAQRPRPRIMMGGASMASARRAARFADGYQPVHPRYYEAYLNELSVLGKELPAAAGRRRGGGGGLCLFISADPEKAWTRLAPHLLHDTNTYAEWAAGGRMPEMAYRAARDLDELRALNVYEVVSPDEAVRLLNERGTATFRPLAGGLDPETAWESLHLLESDVLPRLSDS
jgi:alkanesulfonate monooxygenase SsuD/methylene tetrahydromethanopterin reductase-like flavin-dependent oxidoreductase (luciferase family)